MIKHANLKTLERLLSLKTRYLHPFEPIFLLYDPQNQPFLSPSARTDIGGNVLPGSEGLRPQALDRPDRIDLPQQPR